MVCKKHFSTAQSLLSVTLFSRLRKTKDTAIHVNLLWMQKGQRTTLISKNLLIKLKIIMCFMYSVTVGNVIFF